MEMHLREKKSKEEEIIKILRSLVRHTEPLKEGNGLDAEPAATSAQAEPLGATGPGASARGLYTVPLSRASISTSLSSVSSSVKCVGHLLGLIGALELVMSG